MNSTEIANIVQSIVGGIVTVVLILAAFTDFFNKKK